LQKSNSYPIRVYHSLIKVLVMMIDVHHWTLFYVYLSVIRSVHNVLFPGSCHPNVNYYFHSPNWTR